MQDQLCDRINGNLKVERKIFARLEDVDQRVREAYDKIYLVQDIALKMGINVDVGNYEQYNF